MPDFPVAATAASFPGFAAPAASFAEPLDMLAACHERITQQCATLQRLQAYLAGPPQAEGQREEQPEVPDTQTPDAAVCRAAAGLLRYFDTAALHHHADEEEDIFPALQQALTSAAALTHANPDAPLPDPQALNQLLAALGAEHRLLEQHWQVIRPALVHLAAGDSATLDATTVTALIELYKTHMQREETEIMPLAARLLSTAELDRAGRAMQQRRGAALPE